MRAIGRILWVMIAFLLAAATALMVLVILGGVWIGGELRATAPGDPVFDALSGVLGVVLFAGAVGPALTALPAVLAVVAGEVLRVRSWIYYVAAGGASLAAVPVMTGLDGVETPIMPAADYLTLFAAAGFAGGFLYWLLAGKRA